MFYYASKILWFFATPSNLLIVLVLLGALLAMTRRFRRFGTASVLVVTLAILALGLLPISSYLMLPLENRFPAYRDDGRQVDGIILLGGAIEASDSAARGSLVANESAERVLDTIGLAYRHPQARLLISGGGGMVFSDGTAEAPIIAAYLRTIGIESSRIIVEDRSRTTYENALHSRSLANPQPGERWLLVTSAWHMPRAIGVFRAAGFPVVPYPVDFRTRGAFGDQRMFIYVSEGLRRLDVATKEWAGLLAYYAAGRTSALLPAPQDSEPLGTVSR
ncbi:MAG: YdcF family protein [Microvirga sp.]|jgi:uncharacterized SAM-binding protein YcdF (DUF218 family)|nr:YdcF family protein [Microvirga sp.]